MSKYAEEMKKKKVIKKKKKIVKKKEDPIAKMIREETDISEYK